MKNEKRCKKHRHFCIVALFFSLPKETKQGAECRPVSHTNALCAPFGMPSGKHTSEQIFPLFCRRIEKVEKTGVTLLYSLSGESASIAFDWSRNTRALPYATRRAEALHPLTFFEKKVSKETFKQKGASIFEK